MMSSTGGDRESSRATAGERHLPWHLGEEDEATLHFWYPSPPTGDALDAGPSFGLDNAKAARTSSSSNECFGAQLKEDSTRDVKKALGRGS